MVGIGVDGCRAGWFGVKVDEVGPHLSGAREVIVCLQPNRTCRTCCPTGNPEAVVVKFFQPHASRRRTTVLTIWADAFLVLSAHSSAKGNKCKASLLRYYLYHGSGPLHMRNREASSSESTDRTVLLQTAVVAPMPDEYVAK